MRDSPGRRTIIAICSGRPRSGRISTRECADHPAWPIARPIRPARLCSGLRRSSGKFRDVFLHLRANIDLARMMFEGYPAFVKNIEEPPVVEATTKSLHAMPRLRSPDDRLTAITRLRFVMEDSDSAAVEFRSPLCHRSAMRTQQSTRARCDTGILERVLSGTGATDRS